jgi:RNA polymerase sigma-70 factor (sigma-E family)
MMACISTDRPPTTPAAGVVDLESAYREHYRSLVRLASLLIDDVGTCEELVQDAFVRTWARGPVVHDAALLPAYLRSAVLNGARSHLRRRMVWRRYLASVVARPPAPPSPSPPPEPDQAVLRALRSLPPRQREVLVLRYFLDLSEAQIADTLGISAGSVKTHASRGLAALAGPLEALR